MLKMLDRILWQMLINMEKLINREWNKVSNSLHKYLIFTYSQICQTGAPITKILVPLHRCLHWYSCSKLDLWRCTQTFRKLPLQKRNMPVWLTNQSSRLGPASPNMHKSSRLLQELWIELQLLDRVAWLYLLLKP